MPQFLYGYWPVLEAIHARRREFDQLILTDGADKKAASEVTSIAEEIGIPIKRVEKRIMDDLADGSNHQGIILRVGEYPYIELDDILQVAQTRNEKPFILLLDLLKDPQNVGTLLRVADAVGIHGIILQERRGVSVTASVVAASSGAVEHLQVAQVTNLVQAMKELKERDVWMVGLDVGPNVPPLGKTDLNMPLGMVLGSEGDGLRRLVRDTCDLLLTLPMRGQVGSLNVATAGSVAVYAAWQARGWDGWAHA